jgi:hypothetical protein
MLHPELVSAVDRVGLDRLLQRTIVGKARTLSRDGRFQLEEWRAFVDVDARQVCPETDRGAGAHEIAVRKQPLFDTLLAEPLFEEVDIHSVVVRRP